MKSDEIYKLFNTLLTSFIAAGGLGFINFAILEKLDIIRAERDKKDEKILFILFFSIVNYALFLLVFSFPQDKLTMKEYVVMLASNIIITLLLSIFLSFTLFPLLAKILKEALNWFRKTVLRKPTGDNLTPKEKAFSPPSTLSTFVYIFDFEEKKIGEGYLSGWLNDTELKNQIILTPPASPTGLDFAQVNELLCQCDNDPEPDTTRHLIDFDSKIHYFIFYQLN